MEDQLESFLQEIPNLGDQKPADLIDYFVYFLTVIRDERGASPADVSRCFELARLKAYSNPATYLRRNSDATSGKPKFIRLNGTYALERSFEIELQKTLRTGPARTETSHILRGLLPKVSDAHEKSYLQEAIDCYEIEARRAAVILTWILAIRHLHRYIFDDKDRLKDFNDALRKDKDRRIKVDRVSKLDDFSEMPESKFIELARAARIISNDVRKILEAKLGIRNSAAHPSEVKIGDLKATECVQDLVENVVLKYEV